MAALIQEGASPESIVAFTFTERAASELKERIINRVAEVKGDGFKGRFAQMFVGTRGGGVNSQASALAVRWLKFDWQIPIESTVIPVFERSGSG